MRHVSKEYNQQPLSRVVIVLIVVKRPCFPNRGSQNTQGRSTQSKRPDQLVRERKAVFRCHACFYFHIPMCNLVKRDVKTRLTIIHHVLAQSQLSYDKKAFAVRLLTRKCHQTNEQLRQFPRQIRSDVGFIWYTADSPFYKAQESTLSQVGYVTCDDGVDIYNKGR